MGKAKYAFRSIKPPSTHEKIHSTDSVSSPECKRVRH